MAVVSSDTVNPLSRRMRGIAASIMHCIFSIGVIAAASLTAIAHIHSCESGLKTTQYKTVNMKAEKAISNIALWLFSVLRKELR